MNAKKKYTHRKSDIIRDTSKYNDWHDADQRGRYSKLTRPGSICCSSIFTLQLSQIPATVFSDIYTVATWIFSSFLSEKSEKKKNVPKVTSKGCSNCLLTENRCCRDRWGQYRYCLVSRWHSQQRFSIHTGARLSPRVVLIVCLAPRS